MAGVSCTVMDCARLTAGELVGNAPHLAWSPNMLPKQLLRWAPLRSDVSLLRVKGSCGEEWYYLKSHTPSDGCMLATIPFMWRVVSVHMLCIATRSPEIRLMSCSSVSEVRTAKPVGSYAWTSCVTDMYHFAVPAVVGELDDVLLEGVGKEESRAPVWCKVPGLSSLLSCGPLSGWERWWALDVSSKLK